MHVFQISIFACCLLLCNEFSPAAQDINGGCGDVLEPFRQKLLSALGPPDTTSQDAAAFVLHRLRQLRHSGTRAAKNPKHLKKRTIIIHGTDESECSTDGINKVRTLSFNVSRLLGSTLTRAQLWLQDTRNVILSANNVEPNHTSFQHATPAGMTKSGWMQVNVTGQSPLGHTFSVRMLRTDNRPPTIDCVGLSIPLLMMKIVEDSKGGMQQRPTRGAFRSRNCPRSRNPPNYEERTKKAKCCRDRVWISFKKLGWHEVVEPRGFYFYLCRGRCPRFSKVIHDSKQLDYIMPLLLYRPLLAIHPCCTPRRYSDLHITTSVRGSNRLNRSMIQNLIVEECFCLGTLPTLLPK